MQIIPRNDDGALAIYFRDVTAAAATTGPLSREREGELAVRILRGDTAARDELVRANLRFVVQVARKYERRGLSLGERISAGNIGLITAAERFDGTKGCKFISYAVWWIRQAILQTIADQARVVRLPTNKVNLLADIYKTSIRLSEGHDGWSNMDEVAAELGVSVEKIAETLAASREVLSLDEPLFEADSNLTLIDTLADPSQEAPDTSALRTSIRRQLDGDLSNLNDREQRIVRLYYGLEGSDRANLGRIGTLLGLTRERVRQIKLGALSKLRQASRRRARLAATNSVD
ncbi:MAG: RNA polymerase sigma factor RpoD/SigA [Candidatus Latescibacterota bacterium]|jgi:RNA polymerase primary sigma factor